MNTTDNVPFQAIRNAAGSEISAIINGLAVEQDGFFLTEEQMLSIDARLAASGEITAQAEALTADLTTARSENAAFANELSSANETIAQLRAEIEQMKAGDATGGTDAGADADRSEATGAAKYFTSVDAEVARRKATFGK